MKPATRLCWEPFEERKLRCWWTCPSKGGCGQLRLLFSWSSSEWATLWFEFAAALHSRGISSHDPSTHRIPALAFHLWCRRLLAGNLQSPWEEGPFPALFTQRLLRAPCAAGLSPGARALERCRLRPSEAAGSTSAGAEEMGLRSRRTLVRSLFLSSFAPQSGWNSLHGGNPVWL